MITRPLPPPKVSGYVQISNDRQLNVTTLGYAQLVTDGPRLYFTEIENGDFKLMQVSAGGGETVPVSTPSEIPSWQTFLPTAPSYWL